MKQSEKLLKLKDAGSTLICLGILIMCMTPVVMMIREVYDFHAWLTVWRWGVGVAFTGLAIRIARFLYLWQYSLGSPSELPFLIDWAHNNASMCFLASCHVLVVTNMAF